KTYKHALSGWSSLTKPANYYIGQFYYDTALSTGESTFASLKEVTDISHILFGSDAHYAPDSWIAKMQKNISESHYFSEQDKVNIFNVNSSRIL
ncbi:MAG: amidohydrolase, partial [Staphylococcus lugdunensis]|nr:amidohydrolase [Staphylococcus lugdunensis]